MQNLFRLSGRSFLLLIILAVIALFLGMMAAQYPPMLLIWAVIGIAIFIGAFLNNELGLYILVFSMLLSPEIMAGKTEGHALGRGVTLRMDDFLLLVIGFSWFAKAAIHKELGLFLKTPLNKPIFYYLLICIISTGIGIMTDRVNAKVGFFFVLKYFEYVFVYFMMINHLENRDQMNRFLICLFATCFLASIYGMLQIPGGGRISAPFEGETGEPNTFGGYLLFIGAVAMGLLTKTENTRTRRLLTVLIIVIIPPLLFTQSRSTYLAIIPTSLALGLMSERRVLIVGIMLIILILSPFLLPKKVKERILFTVTQREQLGQIALGNIKIDTSTSARLISWKEAILESISHPILGHGVTGFKFLDAQFPKILVETGFLGLGAFIYLIYSIFKLAIAHAKQLKTPYLKGLIFGFIAGFIGLLFHAIGANTFIIVRIMEPFWFVVGIITVLPNLEAKDAPLTQSG